MGHAKLGAGAIALANGDSAVASSESREAWAIFNELGFAYDSARARVQLAQAYLLAGHDEDAKMQLDAAIKTFSELGAGPDLAQAKELSEQAH